MSFVDRVPRPWLIGGGLLSCGALVGILAALQSFYLDTENRAGLGACVAIIFLFQATFSLALDGPTYFYIAEIWPSHVRSQGFAIAMAVLSGTNLMWLQATPYAISTISWRWYLVFTCIPGAAAVVVFFWFKDTRNKPLEEIAGMFGDEDMVAVYQRELNIGELDDAEGVESYNKGSNGPSVEMVEEA
jgi:MFS family permease